MELTSAAGELVIVRLSRVRTEWSLERLCTEKSMKLRPIGFYKELPHGTPEGGSLEEMRSELAQDGQNRILEYLKSGEVFIACPGVVKDVLSPEERIVGGLNILTDGNWAWPQDLIYYVENYNVALPREFVSHMADNTWKVPDVDLTALEL